MNLECNPSNPIFLAWTAAWLDADGWISLYRRTDTSKTSFQVKVSIGQMNSLPLEIILKGFPFGKISVRKDGLCTLSYSCTRAIKFIKPLIPYLVIKHERAEIIIRAQEIISRRYNRWHPRPQEEIDELFRLKNRIHEITKVSVSSRKKQIGGRNNALPSGQWAREYESCKECDTTEIRHCAKGYCHRCYSRIYAKKARSTVKNIK